MVLCLEVPELPDEIDDGFGGTMPSDQLRESKFLNVEVARGTDLVPCQDLPI